MQTLSALLVAAASTVVLAIGTHASADAECGRPAGKPIYRQERGPLRPPPAAATGRGMKPTETLAIYASGAWIWVGPDADRQEGCIARAALRELTRSVTRATFRFPRGPVATCTAVNFERVTYAAPRRGKRLSTEAPCGTPPDVSTGRLIACAEAVRRTPALPVGEVRAICRG